MKCLNDVNYKDCVGKVYKSKSSGDLSNPITPFTLIKSIENKS